MWRSLGLTDPRDAGKRLTDRDIDLVNFMVMARGLVGEDNVLDIARAFGTAIAQMAETSVTALRRGFERPQRGGDGSELAIQQAYGAFPDVVMPDLMRAIETVFLRGVVTAVYAEIADNDGTAVQSHRTIVFVDLVDFTALARTYADGRTVAASVCVRERGGRRGRPRGGRVVKMLGDGAMLVFAHRADGIEAARALVRHATCRRAAPGSRAAAVFTRTADYFGPVVNLASRLSGRGRLGRSGHRRQRTGRRRAQQMPDRRAQGHDDRHAVAYYRSR